MSWAAGAFARSIGAPGVACPKVCGGEGVTGGSDAGACGVARSATTGEGASEIASPVERVLGLTDESTNSSGSDGELAIASALGDAATGGSEGVAGGSDAGACGVARSATTGEGASEIASPVERVLGLTDESTNSSGSDGELAIASALGDAATGGSEGVAGGSDAGACGVASAARLGIDGNELEATGLGAGPAPKGEAGPDAMTLPDDADVSVVSCGGTAFAAAASTDCSAGTVDLLDGSAPPSRDWDSA
ncbi:hypothetical protein SAMN05519103_09171 [Rhizobiales bacterium GAS113]|nr:hypothetical protein SAMN05519103_09171 [Rhizobiales bacterium GAS113]